MTHETTIDIEQAKQRARAELEAHREKKRREREAKELAAQTADDEIAALVRARRAEEEHRAQIRAELDRCYAEREAKIAAERQAEQERKLAADPRRQIAEHPARRVAKLLRQRLGDDFEAVLADIRSVNFNQLKVELARIPDDERAEALHRQRQELAAKLAAEATTLPEPESEEEVAILRRHGFPG